jgi:hypothetical protein
MVIPFQWLNGTSMVIHTEMKEGFEEFANKFIFHAQTIIYGKPPLGCLLNFGIYFN